MNNLFDAGVGGPLSAPEARFAEIVNIADDAIISVNEAQAITLFNQGAERIFGFEAGEVLGKPLDVLLPDRFHHIHSGHLRTFAGGPETARMMAQRGQIFGRRKDGSEFPAEASISKLRLRNETVFTVILRDVSQRQAAEEELRRAHDELELRVKERTAELSEKNRALQQQILDTQRAEERLTRQARELARSNADLEQFAYVASHDLQEPLRMIASFTQLLERRYKDRLDGEGREFIGFIVDGAIRLQHLINDLLTFSRVGTRAKEFKPTNCGLVMQQVLANLNAAIEESGATVSFSTLPTVMADETQMALLLQNLVGNAIKFHGAAPPQVHVAAEQEGGEWLFTVSDNGIGFEPQYAERIFVVFQRLHTTAEYPGTGIGLAVCKKIVERHGGHIGVESKPGQGSTFHFTIPLREEIPHG